MEAQPLDPSQLIRVMPEERGGARVHGRQVPLYPMIDDFVGIIADALTALGPYRDRRRVDTDDVSTLMVGPPEVLFPALRPLYVAAASTRAHRVPRCREVTQANQTTPYAAPAAPISWPLRESPWRSGGLRFLWPWDALPRLGRPQPRTLLYVVDWIDHMVEIYGCMDFLRTSGTFDRSKNFCTGLKGDAEPVFAALAQAYCRFGHRKDTLPWT